MPYPYSLMDPPPATQPNAYQLPTEFVAGDSFELRVQTSAYPPSQGWSLTLSMRAAVDDPIDLNSTVDGDYLISEVPTNTRLWKPGSYLAQLYAVNTNKRTTLWELPFEIRTNLFTTDATDSDLRSNAEKILEAIEITMLGRASNDILESHIDLTSFRRMTPEDLQKAHSYWSARVRSERALARSKAGLGTGRLILTRFVRPS